MSLDKICNKNTDCVATVTGCDYCKNENTCAKCQSQKSLVILSIIKFLIGYKKQYLYFNL